MRDLADEALRAAAAVRAENLRRLRAERGLTGPELHALTGITASRIYALEHGRQPLSLATIDRFALVFDLTPAQLLAELDGTAPAGAAEVVQGGMTRGKFIVIEGPDGTGKSALATALARNLKALATHEPFFSRARQWLREKTVSDLELAIAMVHDRHAHLREIVEPALARGETVVCERYVLSTLIYQGSTLMPAKAKDKLRAAVLDVITGGVREPDLVLVLDAPPEITEERLRRRLGDRFEQDAELQARVRAQYLEVARERSYPVLDGSVPREAVLAAALAIVRG